MSWTNGLTLQQAAWGGQSSLPAAFPQRPGGAAVTPPKQVGACRMESNFCSQSKQSLRNKSTRGKNTFQRWSGNISRIFILLSSWHFLLLFFGKEIYRLASRHHLSVVTLPAYRQHCLFVHSKELYLGGETFSLKYLSLLWGFGVWHSWVPGTCLPVALLYVLHTHSQNSTGS